MVRIIRVPVAVKIRASDAASTVAVSLDEFLNVSVPNCTQPSRVIPRAVLHCKVSSVIEQQSPGVLLIIKYASSSASSAADAPSQTYGVDHELVLGSASSAASPARMP